MTWLDVPDDHPYGLATLPYGVFSTGDGIASVGVRIGDQVVDLAEVAEVEGHPLADVFASSSLNPLMALGRHGWSDVRRWVGTLLTDEANRDVVTANSHPLSAVTMHLPVEVADYVDFYASEQHATNVGQIFRPDSPGLPPNWKHLPIGYHGRAGTVVVSGTDVVRPSGQRRPEPGSPPPFGPSTRLDIECEVGFLVGPGSRLGVPVPLDDARNHIFGVVLLNDWSARDIQAWEYVPLGPFLGKSFATSISAWVVPFQALEPALVELPSQDPAVLAYLSGDSVFGLDLHLEVVLNDTVVSRPEYQTMYWSPAQMLAHLTVNGASLRTGDLFGSGTVSGSVPETFGSLLEISWNGERPIALADGSTRGFLEDGDTVTLRGTAPGAGGSVVTLGEVTGTVVAAGAAVDQMDSALSVALGTVWRDVPAVLKALVVVEAPSPTPDDQDHVMIRDRDGSAFGVDTGLSDDAAEQLWHVSDRLQDGLHESLWSAGLSAVWPECPEHPGTHPLQVRLIAAGVFWVCPKTAAVVASVGRLLP
ncbi:MAG: fumarylacetoacetase [Nocardioidaceae bacterium]